MEISGIENSFLFTSTVSAPGGKKTIVREARDTLITSGQPRTFKNDLAPQSLNITGRQVPYFGADLALASFRLDNPVKSTTERTEKTKSTVADDIEQSSHFTVLI